MSYYALVTTIKNVHKDPNSDHLYLGECFSEGIIVGPDMHSGDKVLYLPFDGKIERWFGDAFKLFRKNEDGTPQGGYIEDNGHIKAIKLRGNKSSGVVISYSRLQEVFPNIDWEIGDKVCEIQGRTFCSKYIPYNKHETPAQQKTSHKGRKRDGVVYPEFAMHIDTQQLAYNLDAFRPGDEINLTLKMHGTSSRHMKTYAVLPNGFWRRLFHLKPKKKMVDVCGSRRVVVAKEDNGFYGTNEFRMKVHEKIVSLLEDGMEVFGEIVGYYGPNEWETIMPIADNKKINDKEFLKKFGSRTVFSYGCQPGENEFYVYRITSENGNVEWTPDEITAWCDRNGVKRVPVIDNFTFTTVEDLQNRIDTYFEDLADPIGKTHVKEGVVVRIVNRRTFTAFKTKTWEFRVLEGIIKETSSTPDMEEAEEIAEPC